MSTAPVWFPSLVPCRACGDKSTQYAIYGTEYLCSACIVMHNQALAEYAQRANAWTRPLRAVPA